MAALTRPTQATYEVHENISVDTQGKNKKLGRPVKDQGEREWCRYVFTLFVS